MAPVLFQTSSQSSQNQHKGCLQSPSSCLSPDPPSLGHPSPLLRSLTPWFPSRVLLITATICCSFSLKYLSSRGTAAEPLLVPPIHTNPPGRGKARDLPTSQVLVLCYAHPTPHHTQLSKRLPCTPAHLILRVICFYFYGCECFPAQMYVCQGHDRCLRRPERGVGSPGTDTVESDSCEP